MKRFIKQHKFLRIAIVFVAVLALLVSTSVPALAATSQDVTVTATPAYITISNSPSTWTINDLGTGTENGKGKILTSTTYYANPVNGNHDTTPPSATVLDAECNFTVDSTGTTVDIDLTCNWGDFSGGDADMTNGDTGSAGATSYGAYSYWSGELYANKVLLKDGASAVAYDGLTAAASIKWGVEIATQTDAWTGGSSSTSTLNVTATQD